MRDIIYSACVLIALVIGLVLGSVITEARLSATVEAELAEIEREEETVMVASARIPEQIEFMEAADWDRRGMGRRAR